MNRACSHRAAQSNDEHKAAPAAKGKAAVAVKAEAPKASKEVAKSKGKSKAAKVCAL